MAITGTYGGFVPEIAECLDESFERAGVEPASIGHEHIGSAMRSIKFMLNSEWNALGLKQWQITRTTQTMSVDLASFNLPAGGIDIVQAVLRRADRDTPMNRISRQEYLDISTKNINGRPDRYWADRQYNQIAITIWRRGENASDQMVYDYFRQIADPGRMTNTLQMPAHVLEAFVAGLAARIAQKYMPAKYDSLRLYYGGPRYPEEVGGALKMALREDRDRGDVSFSIDR
jgi:hypothetical protein